MKNQNAPFLITAFSILLLFAGTNTTLLWDETTIGTILGQLLSFIGFIFATVMLFFPSGIKWILMSKLLAVSTMLLPLVDELVSYSYPIHFDGFALPMNLALIPVSIASIIAIYLHQSSKTVAT